MKKIVALIFIIILVFGIYPMNSLAVLGKILLDPSSNNIRAGETVKITLKVTNGDDISNITGDILFNENQLVYQSFTKSINSNWNISGPTITKGKLRFIIDDSTGKNPIQSSTSLLILTFKVGDLSPGTEVKVSTSDIKIVSSDGKSEVGVSNYSLSMNVSEPLSGNAYLKSLTVKEATLSPAFKNSVYDYSVSVPFETAKLTVTALAEDSSSKVAISDTNLTAGATKNITVTVTAQTGAKKTYTIKATRAKDPNYKQSDNADLAEIKPSIGILSPVFNAAVLDYVIYLPFETEEIKFTTKKADLGAKEPLIEGPEKLEVGENTFKITGVSESDKIKIYSVTVIRAMLFDPNKGSSSQNSEVSSTISEPEQYKPTGFKLFSKTGYIIIGITAFHIILFSFVAVLYFKTKKGKRAK
jgi:hypothetical protein